MKKRRKQRIKTRRFRGNLWGQAQSKRKHPLAYESWIRMRSRINNPNDPFYSDYGGRGITLDSSWDSFEQFLKDMGDHPVIGERYSLDRINNDGNYNKANCRWATAQEQANNRRI